MAPTWLFFTLSILFERPLKSLEDLQSAFVKTLKGKGDKNKDIFTENL